LVPIQHSPTHSVAILLQGDRCQVGEQSFPDTVAAELRTHEQVFEVEPRSAAPRGIVVKEESKARRCTTPLREYRPIPRCWTKAIAEQVSLSSDDLLRSALIFRKFSYELKDERDISARGRTDLKHALKLYWQFSWISGA